MSTAILTSLLRRSVAVRRWIEDEAGRARPRTWRLLKLKTLQLVISDRLRRLVAAGDAQFGNFGHNAVPVPVRIRQRGGRH